MLEHERCVYLYFVICFKNPFNVYACTGMLHALKRKLGADVFPVIDQVSKKQKTKNKQKTKETSLNALGHNRGIPYGLCVSLVREVYTHIFTICMQKAKAQISILT